MDRRAFLKLLSLGAGATAAGVVLPEVEPVRRWWQVGRGAPVGEQGEMQVSSNGIEWTQCDSLPSFADLSTSLDGIGSPPADWTMRGPVHVCDTVHLSVGGRSFAVEVDRDRGATQLEIQTALIVGLRDRHPEALRLFTGDDVRRALGSCWEGVAQQIEAEREIPPIVLRIS